MFKALGALAGKFQRAVHQLKQDSQRWGPARSAYILVMRNIAQYAGLHLAWVNRREIFRDPDVPAVPPSYSVRQLTADDYTSVIKAADVALEMDEEFVTQVLDQGHFCVGAFYNERLVSYTWRAFSQTPVSDRFSLSIEKPNRYGYKALTLPEHRGKQLQNSINLFSDKLCFDTGYTSAVAFVETHNYASLASDARRGNKQVGWILWRDRHPLDFCYTSKGARGAGVTLVRR